MVHPLVIIFIALRSPNFPVQSPSGSFNMAEEIDGKMDLPAKECETKEKGASGDGESTKMDTSDHGGDDSKSTEQTVTDTNLANNAEKSEQSEHVEQIEASTKSTDVSDFKAIAPAAPTTESTTPKETVDFKIVYNKQKHDVTFGLDETVATLKLHIQTLTGVPPAMQKVMFKGLMKDDKTLRELKVTKGAKMMVVGSTLNDVIAVNTPSTEAGKEEQSESAPTKEPLSKQKPHKKVLEKGKPDDALPGIKGIKERLPTVPLSGMLNKAGGKVRLTFKLEVDQVWIGTKERTEKVPMASIKNVISEPIDGHEEYHMLALQLGPTEASGTGFTGYQHST
ncbi:ubiquitin domain-containing protein UBFD1-like [Ptychodera flava]|uniref:ubiquitin domain-containing protein UBFD1-like n=1 Tax=Ptychodera flava TaxID=63121 RepID=UPI00396A3F21